MKAKCPVCGLIFEPRGAGTRRQQRYCSHKCKIRYKQQIYRARKKGLEPPVHDEEYENPYDIDNIVSAMERKYLEQNSDTKKRICYG